MNECASRSPWPKLILQVFHTFSGHRTCSFWLRSRAPIVINSINVIKVKLLISAPLKQIIFLRPCNRPKYLGGKLPPPPAAPHPTRLNPAFLGDIHHSVSTVHGYRYKTHGSSRPICSDCYLCIKFQCLLQVIYNGLIIQAASMKPMRPRRCLHLSVPNLITNVVLESSYFAQVIITDRILVLK